MTPCRHCGARWRLHDEWICPKRPAVNPREHLLARLTRPAPRVPRGAARMTPAEIDAEVAKFRAEMDKYPTAEEPKR